MKMKKSQKFSGRAALLLSLALALLFSGAVLVSGALQRRSGRQPLTVAPAPVSEDRLLTGGDDPDRIPTELLPGEHIDINSASAEELRRLPGIGESISQAIVDYREAHGPFASVEELLEVRGIGEKKLAAIRDLVCADPPPGDAAAAAGG